MSTEQKKIPDYADIQKLENLAWSSFPSYLDYAKMYHKLATEYGEDVLLDCLEQYIQGPAW